MPHAGPLVRRRRTKRKFGLGAWPIWPFASPPLFTALGVVLYLLHSSSDYVVWALIWIPISLAAIAGASERRAAASRPETTAGSPWRRIAHGFSALAILLMFIVPHIANHLTGRIQVANA
jgi:hypothetical protein